jgi:polar amino acid transport system permease protein
MSAENESAVVDRSAPHPQRAPDRRESAKATAADADLIIRRPKYGQWILAVVLAFFIASFLATILSSPNMDLATIGHYLFAPEILSGVGVTLQLTAIAMVFGILLGIGMALARMSGNAVLRAAGAAYVWFFRGTPLLVQLLFWGFLGAFMETIGIGIPFTGILFVSIPTQALLSPFVAAVIGLTLNQAAESCEIVRAGFLSVPKGQMEAAMAVGLPRSERFFRIQLPQAMRVVVPPMSNALILMLKQTSLVSIIGGLDLMTRAQNIYLQTFEVIPILMVATIWYLALTSVLMVLQTVLERKFGRGY